VQFKRPYHEENAWKKVAIIDDRPFGYSFRNRELHVAGEWPSIRIGFCVCEYLPPDPYDGTNNGNSCKVNTYHIDIGGNVTMYTPIQGIEKAYFHQHMTGGSGSHRSSPSRVNASHDAVVTSLMSKPPKTAKLPSLSTHPAAQKRWTLM
jgi:hypothetical protein